MSSALLKQHIGYFCGVRLDVQKMRCQVGQGWAQACNSCICVPHSWQAKAPKPTISCCFCPATSSKHDMRPCHFCCLGTALPVFCRASCYWPEPKKPQGTPGVLFNAGHEPR
eukprot:418601-Pelagomonas_calceolata.AAC.8